MRVVWIMSAYNSENTIAAALRSIQAQTCADWELVIVDDCSQDRTAQILESYAQLSPQIRILTNSKNMNIAASLNRP